MGRRLAAGVSGTAGFGSISVTSSTISTTTTNGDLTLDPNGTGTVQVSADLTVTGDLTLANQGDLRLRETSGNGTNYIAQQAAANMASNYTLTWPSTVASSTGFVLSSDTSGVLSWVSAGGNITVSDPGSTATVHYPLFGTNAGSLPSTLSPLARTNLAFVPSTGELTATAFNGANHYGSNSNSGTITIRGTTSATKATASVLMTDGVTSSSTTTGTLVVTGGVGISGQLTATTLVETSSIAFKENITPIDNALGLILQLVGVTYDRKDNKEHEAGLIAEEVFRIAPDLVSLDSEGKPYGVKYTKLSAYLIESIQTLTNEIAELKGNR
jgi:hypothetical protein